MTQVKRLRDKLRTFATLGLGAAGILALVAFAWSRESAASERALSSRIDPAQGTGAALATGPHVDGAHFSVDGALVGSCAPATECAVALKLTVRDDYHVNVDYPHKFTALDAPGVEFLGKDPARKNVFSKSAGDFVSSDPKSAVLTVRFKAQAGSPTISGTLKLGVCSEQNCLLPQVDIAVPVTVK